VPAALHSEEHFCHRQQQTTANSACLLSARLRYFCYAPQPCVPWHAHALAMLVCDHFRHRKKLARASLLAALAQAENFYVLLTNKSVSFPSFSGRRQCSHPARRLFAHRITRPPKSSQLHPAPQPQHQVPFACPLFATFFETLLFFTFSKKTQSQPLQIEYQEKCCIVMILRFWFLIVDHWSFWLGSAGTRSGTVQHSMRKQKEVEHPSGGDKQIRRMLCCCCSLFLLPP